MPKKIDIEVPQSSPVWEAIETHLRARMQELLQDMLMEEADELLARARYQRRAPDNPKVYRNGFGKPRRVDDDGNAHGATASHPWFGRAIREPDPAVLHAPNEGSGRAPAGAVSARARPW